jgi:hypothetical protein
MTYTPGANPFILYYYTDLIHEGSEWVYKLRRRTVYSSVTELSQPDPTFDLRIAGKPGSYPVPADGLFTPKVTVNYHSTVGRYIVIYQCYTQALKQDLCVQSSTSGDLITTSGARIELRATDSNSPGRSFGLRLDLDPGIPKDGLGRYSLGQFNVRKDGYGQMFNDGSPIIVYFPAMAGVASGSGVYQMQTIYARQANVPPATP